MVTPTQEPQTPPHGDNQANQGTSTSGTIRDILQSDLVKRIVGKDIYEALKRLLALSSILSALFTYPNPIPFGVLMIFLGGYASAIGLHRERGRFTKGLILPTIFVLVGISILVYRDPIKAALIDSLTSFKIKSLKWSPRNHLLEATQKLTDNSRNSYATSTVLVNSSTGTQVKASETSQVADILFTTNSLVFLLGPARSGKEFIARDWAYGIAEQAKYDKRSQVSYVFYIEADRITADDLKTPSWPKILSSLYKDVIDDEDYYKTVLRDRPSLIVLSNLERVGRDKGREPSITIADTLVRSALTLSEKH